MEGDLKLKTSPVEAEDGGPSSHRTRSVAQSTTSEILRAEVSSVDEDSDLSVSKDKKKLLWSGSKNTMKKKLDL